MLYLHDCGFCASNVYLLVGEACLETCTRFLARRAGGAGSCSLVGRVMSQGMSRGSFGFRKSLGCLSVDGKGCVPTRFVVRPETSGLKPVVYWVRPDHSAKTSAWKTHVNECSPIYPPPVSISLWWATAAPSSPGDPLKPAGRSGPALSQITAFALILSVCTL